MKILILLISILFFRVEAEAVVIDFGLTQFSNSFTQASESKSSETFVSFGILADLSKGEGPLNFGWTVLSVSTAIETPLVSEKLSSIDMGPALRWGIDQKKLFSLTLAYGIYAKGKYETQTTSESLTGTSLFVKFAVEPAISESMNLGVSINYYSPSYGKSVLESVETDVSYKGTQLFPALSMSYKF